MGTRKYKKFEYKNFKFRVEVEPDIFTHTIEVYSENMKDLCYKHSTYNCPTSKIEETLKSMYDQLEKYVDDYIKNNNKTNIEVILNKLEFKNLTLYN